MSRGYVYVLSNPAMPGLVKIGRTIHNPEDRARQLDNTGVPMPFVVECSVLSPDCAALESEAHDLLFDKRARAGREFFHAEPKEVERLLRSLLVSQVELWVEEFLPAHVLLTCSDHYDLMQRAKQ